MEQRPNYTDVIEHHRRTLLGTERTPSITEEQGISPDIAALRVEANLANRLIEFTAAQILHAEMARGRTIYQGHSASNVETEETLEARHADGIARVVFKVNPEPLAERIVEQNKLTPHTERKLRALKVETPKRIRIAQHPSQAGEVLEQFFKRPLDIFRNTYFGDQKNLTISSPAVANRVDSWLEYRLRHYWEELVVEQKNLGTSPIELTRKFGAYMRDKLEELNRDAAVLPQEIETYFALEDRIAGMDSAAEEYLTTYKQLYDLAHKIGSRFRPCHEVTDLKKRREDWSLIGKMLKTEDVQTFQPQKVDYGTLEMQRERQAIRKAAEQFKREASFQLLAVENIDHPLYLQNLYSTLFGSTPDENQEPFLLQLLSPVRPAKQRKIKSINLDFV